MKSLNNCVCETPPGENGCESSYSMTFLTTELMNSLIQHLIYTKTKAWLHIRIKFCAYSNILFTFIWNMQQIYSIRWYYLQWKRKDFSEIYSINNEYIEIKCESVCSLTGNINSVIFFYLKTKLHFNQRKWMMSNY